MTRTEVPQAGQKIESRRLRGLDRVGDARVVKDWRNGRELIPADLVVMRALGASYRIISLRAGTSVHQVRMFFATLGGDPVQLSARRWKIKPRGEG